MTSLEQQQRDREYIEFRKANVARHEWDGGFYAVLCGICAFLLLLAMLGVWYSDYPNLSKIAAGALGLTMVYSGIKAIFYEETIRCGKRATEATIKQYEDEYQKTYGSEP